VREEQLCEHEPSEGADRKKSYHSMAGRRSWS
jgi:hypothetical protein